MQTRQIDSRFLISRQGFPLSPKHQPSCRSHRRIFAAMKKSPSLACEAELSVEQLVPGIWDSRKTPVAAILRIRDHRSWLPVYRRVAVLPHLGQIRHVEEPDSTVNLSDLFDNVVDRLVRPRLGLIHRWRVDVRIRIRIAVPAFVPRPSTKEPIDERFTNCARLSSLLIYIFSIFT